MKVLCIQSDDGPVTMSGTRGAEGMAILADFKKHIQRKWPRSEVCWLDVSEEESAKLAKLAKSAKLFNLGDKNNVGS